MSDPIEAGRFDQMAGLLRDRSSRRAIEEQLPAYLREQRWFGGRTRDIHGARIRCWADLGGDAGACLSIVEVQDATGKRTEHQVYLAPGGASLVEDALQLPRVRTRLMELFLEQATVEGEGMTLAMNVTRPVRCDPGESRILGADQSNTSLVFGASCFLKVYRRLERGPNPDVELGRYLSEGAHFTGVPAFLATAVAEYDGSSAELMALQSWVPSEGDAWVSAVDSCRASANPEGRPALIEEASALAERLGRATAQLHAALALATGPGLAPANPTDDDRADWVRTIGEEVEALRGQAAGGPALEATLARVARLPLDLPGDCGLKIRVHGDYHLGQVLKTGDEFVVLDFEGEPSRPLRERRALQSPLVDVAGMLRSWDYATRTCQNQATGDEARAAAREWGAAVRGRFLAGYWLESGRAERGFLPADEESRGRLLQVFELRKALYEVRYELNNRPDWVAIPMGAVERLAEVWV